MSSVSESKSIAAQRNVELSLLDALRCYAPEVYALWRHHPDYTPSEAEVEESSSSSSSDDDEEHDSKDESTKTPPPPPKEKGGSDNAAHASDEPIGLLRRQHIAYVLTRLGEESSSSQGLYPAQPWIVYWALQAADMLGCTKQLLQLVPGTAIGEFLLRCLSSDEPPTATASTSPSSAEKAKARACAKATSSSNEAAEEANVEAEEEGKARPVLMGFAGGPCAQVPHLASSYAACCALCILGYPEYLTRLPRAALKRWLLSLRNKDGGFSVHWGGESDIRASYCAAVLVTLLRLDEPGTFSRFATTAMDDAEDVRDTPVLTPQTARYVASCQTHEGGFSCSGDASEAHGAYTQCGLAALLLMKQPQLIHLAPLRRWLAARQFAFEGGFNGRTNKLVDSCYSHWVGASHVLLRVAESYVKLLSAALPPSSPSSDAPPAPALLSVDTILLDHAQLMDVDGLVCDDEAAWDAAETAHMVACDRVERFLSADDSVLRVGALQERKLREHWAALQRHDELTQPSPHAAQTEPSAAAARDKARRHFTMAAVGDYYFNQRKLEQYVLQCCQDKDEGGLMDKPGTPNDSYHTCYSLSGMSSAQNLQYLTHVRSASPYVKRAFAKAYIPGAKTTEQLERHPDKAGGYGVVLGVEGPSAAADVSLVRTTNPIFNMHRSRVVSAMSAWGLKTIL